MVFTTFLVTRRSMGFLSVKKSFYVWPNKLLKSTNCIRTSTYNVHTYIIQLLRQHCARRLHVYQVPFKERVVKLVQAHSGRSVFELPCENRFQWSSHKNIYEYSHIPVLWLFKTETFAVYTSQTLHQTCSFTNFPSDLKINRY